MKYLRKTNNSPSISIKLNGKYVIDKKSRLVKKNEYVIYRKRIHLKVPVSQIDSSSVLDLSIL